MPSYRATQLSDLVNPQVMADFIDKKLVDNMVFAPLATIDNTLAGRAGDTISMPVYNYTGDASILGELSTLSVVELTTSTASVSVVKAAKGIEISDEAVLSGFGDPVAEATDQIVLGVASKVDNEMLAKLHAITGTMLYETSATTVDPAVDDIYDALEKFGEDIDGVKVIVVAPALYTAIRKSTLWLPASEISANVLIRGAVGEISGCQVIVSNKLKTSKDAYIVKPGALRLFMKRDTLVETDRDIKKFSTLITASKHFACYLYDASKAIRIAVKSAE